MLLSMRLQRVAHYLVTEQQLQMERSQVISVSQTSTLNP